MSKETLALVEGMNPKSLEVQLALQCAPALTGIKTANLLIIENELAQGLPIVLEGEELLYHLLYQLENRLVYLIYNKRLLEEYLGCWKVSLLLELWGYKAKDLSAVFAEVSSRYQAYLAGKACFPHELGLLLGYPVEDVLGFIKHQGQNFLYKGYWKVYENPEQAKLFFEACDRAREMAVVTVFQGNSIKSILNTGRQEIQSSWQRPSKRAFHPPEKLLCF